jgi:hypothetical protein
VEPSAYRCAVVSERELAELRQIGDVVRLGHVKAIEHDRLVLGRGDVAASPDTLYIDCSASALQRSGVGRVFDGDTINLVMVTNCRPMFSAAVIAAIEAAGGSEAEKNAISAPIPVPELPADWLRLRAASMRNVHAWNQHPKLKEWLRGSRLDATAVLSGGRRPSNEEAQAAMRQLVEAAGAAAQAMPRLLAAVA